MPGRIIQGMKQAGTRNPVFLLDEIDKLGVSFQGDPASALLEVLDPAQNDTFVDHYLGVPFDLSEVLFIATANFIQNIPGPLPDRMEVVDFAGYTEREKSEIARKYLIPRQFRRTGEPGALEVTDDALTEVITAYTRESGVRGWSESSASWLGRSRGRSPPGSRAHHDRPRDGGAIRRVKYMKKKRHPMEHPPIPSRNPRSPVRSQVRPGSSAMRACKVSAWPPGCTNSRG